MPQEQMDVLQAAAEAGDAESQLRLANAMSHYQGYNFRAFQWIQRAANVQHPYAEFLMGQILSGDLLVVERGVENMDSWLSASGNALKWRVIPGTRDFQLVSDQRAAVQWLERAAAHGVFDAWRSLSKAYREGGGTVPDAARSAKWLRMLADAGDPSGILEYAKCLENGVGVERNPIQAMAWLSLLISSAYPEESAIGEFSRVASHRIGATLSSGQYAEITKARDELARRVKVCIGGLEYCLPSYPGAQNPPLTRVRRAW